MNQKYNIAVLGATGAVGETVLAILAERKFPVGKLYPLASRASTGHEVIFNRRSVPVQVADEVDFSKVDICFSAVENAVIEKLAPEMTASGCLVIDKSSVFRYDNDVPLVVPEVNAEAILDYRERNIIAVPNCSTIPIVVALKPIYDAVGIERINAVTYQSVSGAGKNGIQELSEQVTDLLNQQKVHIKHFPVQMAFNVIPHIDSFLDNRYTKEEMKVVWETRKILNDTSILINPTAVRVPVFYGHCVSLHIETADKISAEQANQLLTHAPGVIVMDTLEPGGYPTPIGLSEQPDAVFVGRIREDISHPRGLNLWVVADNIRKGAALNAVQIAELFIHRNM